MALSPLLTVRQLMRPEPIAVPPEEKVHEVVRLMNQRRIGAVLVQRAGKLVGIFTERDMLRNAVAAPPDWRDGCVANWMTPNPHTISPDATWEQARGQMETLHVRHLPVLERDRIVGILTARDLMAQSNEQLNRMVEDRTRELRETNERLQHRDAELMMHMAVAGRIQSRLLPPKRCTLQGIDCAVHYEPLDPLGGDYYDFARPDDRHLGILIADATGHSIPAALVALMARTAFMAASRSSTSPAAVLQQMNRHLYGLTGEHFVTAFYAVLDRETWRLTSANAGHPAPFLHRPARSSCVALEGRGFLLGIMEESTYEETTLDLEPGDQLLFYTDGVIESRGAGDLLYGGDGVKSFLQKAGPQSALSLVENQAQELVSFRMGRPAGDDITLLAAVIA